MAFQKGNPGGPGRPPKVVEDARQSILFELFDEQAERAIVSNMIANAKRKGVMAAPSAINAATWLWDRKYGKVKDRQEISGPDGGPIEIDDARQQLFNALAGGTSSGDPDADSSGG